MAASCSAGRRAWSARVSWSGMPPALLSPSASRPFQPVLACAKAALHKLEKAGGEGSSGRLPHRRSARAEDLLEGPTGAKPYLRTDYFVGEDHIAKDHAAPEWWAHRPFRPAAEGSPGFGRPRRRRRFAAVQN